MDFSASARMADKTISSCNALGRGHISPAQQMMSSCAGACLVSLFMTPLDVVKIRLQVQENRNKCLLYNNGIMDHYYPRVNGGPPPVALHTAEEICNCKWYNRPKYFNGMMDAVMKISRVEGIHSLWSGLSPTLVLAVPATVVYFTAYEHLKEHIQEELGASPDVSAVTSGAGARTFACTLVSPLELIRTKMQSQKMAFYEVRRALVTTIRYEGFGGLWKGWHATILRDVPFSAIYWPFYERLRPKQFNFWQTLFAGAVAGSTAAAMTLPMDVVKTRIQAELGERIVRSDYSRATSAISKLKEIWTQQGIRGLFTGLTPRTLKVAPACAIMISSFEYCKNFFITRNRRLACPTDGEE